MYGIAHCLIDRDGRVIGCNLPIGNGPLLEQAPAMAQILRELSLACRPSSYAPAPLKCLIGSILGEIESRARMTSSSARRLAIHQQKPRHAGGVLSCDCAQRTRGSARQIAFASDELSSAPQLVEQRRIRRQ